MLILEQLTVLWNRWSPWVAQHLFGLLMFIAIAYLAVRIIQEAKKLEALRWRALFKILFTVLWIPVVLVGLFAFLWFVSYLVRSYVPNRLEQTRMIIEDANALIETGESQAVFPTTTQGGDASGGAPAQPQPAAPAPQLLCDPGRDVSGLPLRRFEGGGPSPTGQVAPQGATLSGEQVGDVCRLASNRDLLVWLGDMP